MDGVTLLGAAEVRAIAQRLELRPSKAFGQNFVIDPNSVRRIVRVAHLSPGMRVLEVGPGLGSLTLALLDVGVDVIAVEVDARLAGQLPSTVAECAPKCLARLQVVQADALRISSEQIDRWQPQPTALVANLPYNVAVPILLHLLSLVTNLQTCLVMVQKEVAERLAAAPGSRVYGAPSVKLQWYGNCEYAGEVSRHVFWPVPNVDSALVRIIRAEPPPCRSTRERVFDVIDTAFGQRRKTLRASLAPLAGDGATSQEVLEAAQVDPGRRPETLRIADFARIADVLGDRIA